MSIRQWDRREALRGELLDLIVEMMALGRTAEGQNTPEFRRLDQELTEKNAELEALNALCSDPNELRELKYRRSVRESHDFLRVIQIFLIVALFACLFFFMRGTARKQRTVGHCCLRTPLLLCLHRMGHLHPLPVQAGIGPSASLPAGQPLFILRQKQGPSADGWSLFPHFTSARMSRFFIKYSTPE